MPNKPAGFQWLKERYDLSRHILTHSSYIGSNESIELTAKGNVEQIYGPKYAPEEDTPLHHIEFALKYDGWLDYSGISSHAEQHKRLRRYIGKVF